MSDSAPLVDLPKDQISELPEFKKLAGVLGSTNAWWILWCTGYIESRFRNYPYRGPKVAMGVFQILPSTAAALSSTWGLPPYDANDVLLQARYALAHLWEDYNYYKRYGLPNWVKIAIPPRSTSVLRTFLGIRTYYHGGPGVRSDSAPVLRYTRPDGRTVKSEILGALNTLITMYNSAIS